MQEARLEDAYRCFEKAITREPESGEAWKRRGVVLGIMGMLPGGSRIIEGGHQDRA